ncbi:MAG: hydrolase 1, exosortase A system-associated [Dechloromonas sp.]|uniref:Hydrolase 1, exosortase A system-associated n=1 Tax=Candidatus Dechloromonas phosphorivorans TaxID=2899244 RepID=A0A9D7QP38_9RHOO|nr:hydrolase 1, exosortase A system-associated [Candidatus Dechloromonas phosphorivorans]
MTFTEHAAIFPCAGDQLLGIVAAPELPQATGVLIVVGGPQYRVGSHRQFLLLSRALAEAGYPAMRFDFRGMGDSTGELRNFETINEDIAAAIDAFQANCPQVERIVLWGLCDAASANLLYWDQTRDARVHGLVLLNPWARSEATLARTHIKHYYGQRLVQAEFWRKLLTGKLGLGRAINGFLRSLKQARKESLPAVQDETLTFQKKMAHAMGTFHGEVLLLLSESDYTAKEFIQAVQADRLWSAAIGRPNITQSEIPEADHTFSSLEWRGQVESITRQWLKTKVNQ